MFMGAPTMTICNEFQTMFGLQNMEETVFWLCSKIAVICDFGSRINVVHNALQYVLVKP